MRSTPAFIDTISAAVPSDIFQAVLTNEQKAKLAKGTIELMTSKKGTLIASLIDPKTKKRTRIGHTTDEKTGKKIRIAKKSNEKID